MNQEHIERWQTEFETADVKIVRQMLAEAPELVSVKVNHTAPNGRIRQWGPLFSASINLKSFDKVKALVEAGADVNNSDPGTHWPSTEYEINRYLLSQGTDINQPCYLGFHAVGVTNFDSFLLMVENGLDPNFAWTHNGETLLHVQSRDDDNTHLAQAYILIKAGANVNAQALSGLETNPSWITSISCNTVRKRRSILPLGWAICGWFGCCSTTVPIRRSKRSAE